jgi:8-oxo-dGTP pyrophosphatase MutT (NUDIX family)
MSGTEIMPYKHDEDLRRRLERNLGAFQLAPEASSSPRVAAAAAIAVVAGPAGQACFLLTVRSSSLKNHAGQFALPGGKSGPGETIEETALRELDEELRPSADFEVLGRLDPFATHSGFLLAPVVAWCGDPVLALDPSPDEVAAAHFVPLSQLDTPGYPAWVDIAGTRVMRMQVLGSFIHAPTGAILYQFREVALHGRTVRVAGEGEPNFAWW